MFADQIGKLVTWAHNAGISGRLGLVAIVPLIVLLIERELFRAYVPDPSRPSRARWTRVAIVPLLGVTTLIFASRLLELLGRI